MRKSRSKMISKLRFPILSHFSFQKHSLQRVNKWVPIFGSSIRPNCIVLRFTIRSNFKGPIEHRVEVHPKRRWTKNSNIWIWRTFVSPYKGIPVDLIRRNKSWFRINVMNPTQLGNSLTKGLLVSVSWNRLFSFLVERSFTLHLPFNSNKFN